MSRKVYISNDMSVDERVLEVAESDPQAAILWPWILTTFDDWGRSSAEPRRIKASTFPAVDTVTADIIREALRHYDRVGLITLYEVDGKQYMYIESDKWFKWQTQIPKAKRFKVESRIPAPPNECDAQTREDARECAEFSADVLKISPSPSPSPSPSGKTYTSSKQNFADDSDEMRLTGELIERIQNNNPTAKVPTTQAAKQSWAKVFDLMMRVDKRPIEDIRAVIAYSQLDKFWSSNILSARKLREKYDTLWMQMPKNRPKVVNLPTGPPDPEDEVQRSIREIRERRRLQNGYNDTG
jgi:hypothetical protein